MSSSASRALRLDQLVHLDLLELVDALDPARVPPGGSPLAPEAGRVGRVVDREEARVEYLARVEPGERHLGSRHEP